MENTIKLKKDNILRIGINDSDNKPTGEHLEFDLEDIELPLRLNECEIKHNNNINWLKMQLQALGKKEDKSGKYLLSWKEEEKIKTLREFYSREMSALDLFLGVNGCKKLLNGRKPYFEMFEDIVEMIEPVLPMLEKNKDNIIDKIKDKYSNKEKGVLE